MPIVTGDCTGIVVGGATGGAGHGPIFDDHFTAVGGRARIIVSAPQTVGLTRAFYGPVEIVAVATSDGTGVVIIIARTI